MERQIKVIVEKHHPDGYVAYPLGVKGGRRSGESYREALEDVQSALAFHMETFGLRISRPLRKIAPTP